MTEHVHWKKLTNPDYIGAYAFEHNEEKTGTICEVKQEMVAGADGKKESCTVIHFTERDLKPLILNRTNAKMITKLYKTGFIDEWVGKRVTMVVRQVKAFGDVVDAVRIKPEIPKAPVKTSPEPGKPILCADCKMPLRPFGNMGVTQLAEYTAKQYGRTLCADCASKVRAAKAVADANGGETDGEKET